MFRWCADYLRPPTDAIVVIALPRSCIPRNAVLRLERRREEAGADGLPFVAVGTSIGGLSRPATAVIYRGRDASRSLA